MTWLFFAAVATVVALWSRAATRRRKDASSTALLMASFQQIGTGRLDHAARLVDAAAKDIRDKTLARVVAVQRAIIALRRGDLVTSRAALDEALSLPRGPLEKVDVAYQIEGAHALRAFVRASLRDRDGALADAASVRAHSGASADGLARVSLAEAILLEQAGEREALKALLTRDRSLLLEHSHPRERAIVRAYQRMLRASASSVYRAAPVADAKSPEDEPDLGDWVAKVVPGAAAFVRIPRRREAGVPPVMAMPLAPTAVAANAVFASRAVGAKAARPSSWLWVSASVVGIGLLAGIALFVFLANSTTSPTSSGIEEPMAHAVRAGEYGSYAFLAMMSALSAGLLARWGWRVFQRRGAPARMAPIAAAAAAFAHGDLDSADRILAPERDSSLDLVAGQAHLYTALIAERRGDFAGSLRAAELGLGRLTDLKTRAVSGLLHPDLIAQRAFALAVHDRCGEAEAELTWLVSSFAYPHQSRATFRVRLVELVRANRLNEAAAWVEQFGGELPLSLHEELLADLVRALGSPGETGAGEHERLADELRIPENRRWIAAVAPRLIDDFEAPAQNEDADVARRVRVAELDPHPVADADVAELAESEAMDPEVPALVRRI